MKHSQLKQLIKEEIQKEIFGKYSTRKAPNFIWL